MKLETFKDIITFFSASVIPIFLFILTVLQYRLQKRQSELENIKNTIQLVQLGDNYNINIDQSNHYGFTEEQEYSKQSYRINRKLENLKYINKYLIIFSPYILILIYVLNLLKFIIPFPKYESSPVLFGNFEKYINFITNSLYKASFPTIVNFLWLIFLLLIILIIRKLISKNFLQKSLGNIGLSVIAYIYFKAFMLVQATNIIDLPTFNLSKLSVTNNQATDIFSSSFPQLIIISLVLLLLVVWFISFHLIQILFESFEEPLDFGLMSNLIPRLFFYSFSLIIASLIIRGIQVIQ
ncbi:hypothetical protein [Lactococcus lactis]|uniref:hypothetical protein n=1 Tax=Lactococcus lactis TaxID=1358 RepID=UPI0022E034FC|nr:hypothetical protein [Lactococcus lactis]